MLFDANVPDGFRYRAGFIAIDEEDVLAEAISRVEFSNFEMRGVVARRRVAFFGNTYDAGLSVAPPIPGFLLPLRRKVGSWANVDPACFVMALINEYAPGAPIGWHRD